MSTVVGVTRAALRARRAQLWRLAGWSAAEVLPAALSGLLTARAVDSGFLAGRPGVGLAWFAVMLGTPIHQFAQLKGGYELSWFSTVWRFAFLQIFCVLAMTLFMLAVLFLALGH